MNSQATRWEVCSDADHPRSRPALARCPVKGKPAAWLVLCSLVLLSGAARANPIIDGYITLQTVVITAPPSFTNIYDEADTASYLAVIASPYYGNVRMSADIYWDYQEFVAGIKLNPATTPDVRCNMNATEMTRGTTSHADLTDRYLATHQLFSVIQAVDNARSLRGILRDGGSITYNGKREFTFRVTYADGGSESWITLGTAPPTLVIEGNVPNSLIQGDGTVKNCPATSGG